MGKFAAYPWKRRITLQTPKFKQLSKLKLCRNWEKACNTWSLMAKRVEYPLDCRRRKTIDRLSQLTHCTNTRLRESKSDLFKIGNCIIRNSMRLIWCLCDIGLVTTVLNRLRLIFNIWLSSLFPLEMYSSNSKTSNVLECILYSCDTLQSALTYIS